MIRSAPFPTSKNSGRSHCPRRYDKIAYCLVGHTSLPYHPIYPQKKLQYSPWCWKAKKSPKYWYIIHRRIIWDSVLWSFSTGPQGQNKKAVKDLSRNMKVWCVRYVVTACDIFDTTCSRFIQKWTVAILIDEENQFSMIFHDHRTYMNISMKSHDSIMIILIYHYHRHRVSMISLSFSMSPTAWSRWSPITFARQWPVPVEWVPKKRSIGHFWSLLDAIVLGFNTSFWEIPRVCLRC